MGHGDSSPRRAAKWDREHSRQNGGLLLSLPVQQGFLYQNVKCSDQHSLYQFFSAGGPPPPHPAWLTHQGTKMVTTPCMLRDLPQRTWSTLSGKMDGINPSHLLLNLRTTSFRGLLRVKFGACYHYSRPQNSGIFKGFSHKYEQTKSKGRSWTSIPSMDTAAAWCIHSLSKIYTSQYSLPLTLDSRWRFFLIILKEKIMTWYVWVCTWICVWRKWKVEANW